VLGILYDIHGNVPALDEVLRDAESAGVDRWLLGGDYGTPSPWPLETLTRLRELPNATWIRGNGERWLREPPRDRPEVMETYDLFLGGLSDEEIDVLYALPAQVELDGILYVHGSPLSDVDSFAAKPQEDEERLLNGVRDRTIVFGHSHLQFRRPGPDGTDLINPGSVGMPLDGDRRAAWAVRTDDGELAFRRVEYDVDRAAAGYRSMGGDFGEFAAARIEKGSD
jgi:predicted phosphodiesterase